MKQIIGSRDSGKTSALIQLSIEKGYTIVCQDAKEKSMIKSYAANHYDGKLPTPIIFSDFMKIDYSGSDISGLLIDNADNFLESIAKSIPIHAITLTKDFEENNENALRSYAEVTGKLINIELDSLREAIGSKMKDLKPGNEPYFSIIVTGEYSKTSRAALVDELKALGWLRIDHQTSGENNEKPGLTEFKLYK